jgi:SAM-dependent methyltransferase
VLDAGCGSGYGSVELARWASSAVGADVSGEALRYAREHYPLANLSFVQASCTELPFAEGSFDLIAAFEVIEHLENWRGFLQEARRLVASGGQCIISTPNKDYYGESRGPTGANPYHLHEFSFAEFRDELRAVFPHISLFLQNHAEGFVFQPAQTFSAAEARVESRAWGPEQSHFFVAVCALSPQTGAPTFLYIPRAANILREREHHIQKLGQEIELKNQTVAELAEARDKLIEMFRRQKDELEKNNAWAEQLDRRLAEAGALIGELQEELAEQARGYEAKIAELEEDSRKKAEWAAETDRRLVEKCQELAQCVDALHNVEKTLEERTTWALNLDNQIRDLEASLGQLRASRWVRLGSALGVGPHLRNG